jgi:hypothetical protein
MTSDHPSRQLRPIEALPDAARAVRQMELPRGHLGMEGNRETKR